MRAASALSSGTAASFFASFAFFASSCLCFSLAAAAAAPAAAAAAASAASSSAAACSFSFSCLLRSCSARWRSFFSFSSFFFCSFLFCRSSSALCCSRSASVSAAGPPGVWPSCARACRRSCFSCTAFFLSCFLCCRSFSRRSCSRSFSVSAGALAGGRPSKKSTLGSGALFFFFFFFCVVFSAGAGAAVALGAGAGVPPRMSSIQPMEASFGFTLPVEKLSGIALRGCSSTATVLLPRFLARVASDLLWWRADAATFAATVWAGAVLGSPSASPVSSAGAFP
mmetsp:Transcript_8626/g.35941  ORF Transcript_8626/g.35941 Transcript_8626/m.35941 type:complete len:283 (-) Transcript_8626:1268-2116(-)